MPARRLTRISAFARHGVILSDPDRSMSGVSTRDGAVVLAMKTTDIRIGDDGCSCLLWSLAMARGAAEGLLVGGEDAGVNPDETVLLRVLRICGEYGARWGFAAPPGTTVATRFAHRPPDQARCAALAA